MAKGKPGADSLPPVTHQINGKNLVDQAISFFGKTPVFWGRYFKQKTTTSTDEYHTGENHLLGSNDIRLLPIGRQTTHVDAGKKTGTHPAHDKAPAANSKNQIFVFMFRVLESSLSFNVSAFLNTSEVHCFIKHYGKRAKSFLSGATFRDKSGPPTFPKERAGSQYQTSGFSRDRPIGDEIKTAFIFARADFVNVLRVSHRKHQWLAASPVVRHLAEQMT